MNRWANVSLSVDEAFSGDHGSGDVGLVDLGHIEELDEPQVLCPYVAWNRDRRRVDHPVGQPLDQKAHFIELNKRDIRRGIQAPHLEHRPGQSVRRRTESRHADSLAFEILGRFDLGIDHEAIEGFVEYRAEENSVGAVQIGADAGIGDRLGNRNFAGEQSLQGQYAAGMNQFERRARIF